MEYRWFLLLAGKLYFIKLYFLVFSDGIMIKTMLIKKIGQQNLELTI